MSAEISQTDGPAICLDAPTESLPVAPEKHSSTTLVRTWLPRVVAIFVIAVITFLLSKLLSDINLQEIRETVHNTPHHVFGAALLFSGISYIALMGYDACAIYTVADRLIRPSVIVIGSFCSYAIGHALGFPLVTAGAVRWKIYGRAGLNFSGVAKLTVIANLTLWMGMFVVLGVALIFYPRVMAGIDHLSPDMNKLVGVVLLLALAAFAGWCGSGERSLGRGNATIPLPDAKTVLIQIMLGFIDVGASAAALWVFLPPEAGISFISFAAVFSAAIVLAMISHVPAGIGAFEATVLLALPDVPVEQTLSALLLWRVAYTLIPFLCASVLFGAYELALSETVAGKTIRHARKLIEPFIPPVIGTLTFIGGIVLLASGAVPNYDSRIEFLRHIVPLPFSEASHLIGSVAGMALLVMSHGLLKRLETAWFLTATVLFAGIVVSLLKGLDWEEAAILAAILALLLAFHKAFYRKGALFSEAPSKAMIALIALFVFGSIWLGFVAYTDVGYRNQLWWNFTWHDDASRFLRAAMAMVVVGAAIIFYFIINTRPARKGFDNIPYDELKTILAAAPRADSHLALLGDKKFLFHPAGDAFLMYRVQGKSWIVMGDPVGPAERAPDLMWSFMEEVDKNGGWPVFYQISPGNIPLYLDGGFSLVKLGEEARVDLQKFSIDGKAGKDWRLALNRMQRDNLAFRIIPADEVPGIIDQLREVSDLWLSHQNAAEKGFSIGYWSDDYISRFDVAVVTRDETIIAFANIWRGPPDGEITVDLIRHRPEENGVMDILFLQVILLGKADGYRWFNLGMAPLSGLSRHRLAPSWHKLASFVAKNGERFYGFGGLRAYKNKFKPQWEPRYLAYPGGWMLPQILLDVTALISGGMIRTIRR